MGVGDILLTTAGDIIKVRPTTNHSQVIYILYAFIAMYNAGVAVNLTLTRFMAR